MARERTLLRRRAGVLAAAMAALALAGTASAAAGPPALASGLPRGHDVSSHQKQVDWEGARSAGARFVYVKATESTGYTSQRVHVDHAGAQLGELPLGQVRVGAEQVIGNHHTEHRIAEKLQALVRFETTAFVGVGAMREGQHQQLGVDVNAERGEQRGQVNGVAPGRPVRQDLSRSVIRPAE